MLITLTSDMGLKDYYVAAMKGAIYSQLPDAKIVDISHNIPPFDILHASFVLKNTFEAGDEVIFPVMGFPLYVKIALQLKIVPKYVDVENEHLTIDVDKLEASINLRFFFDLSIFIAFLSNPFAIITSRKILLNSKANLSVILKLQETIPPKALIGSHAKAFL